MSKYEHTYRFKNVRHAAVLHASVCVVLPEHGAPPNCSELDVRERFRSPPPQASEHCDQAVHAFHVQSIATDIS